MPPCRFPHYPSGYSVGLANVISVAAVDHYDNTVWRGSNYGRKSVQIAAPHGTLTTALRGTYLSLYGTSFAAPHVTGGAVLLLAYLQSLGISVDLPNRHVASLVRNAMVSTTHEVGLGAGPIGGGMLYLPGALRALRLEISRQEL